MGRTPVGNQSYIRSSETRLDAPERVPATPLLVTAGNSTLTSEAFALADGEAGSGVSAVSGDALPALEGGIGSAYRIDPPTVYDKVREVSIPIPPGVNPDSVGVAYHSEAPGGGAVDRYEEGRRGYARREPSPRAEKGGWFPVENVAGFADVPRISRNETGDPVLTLFVHHGGVVSLLKR